MKFKVLIPLLILVLATVGCEFSFSSANIDNERLARDQDGNDRTEVFDTTDTVYVVLDLKNAPDSTTIQARWAATDVVGYEENEEIGLSEELETSSGVVWFSFAPETMWIPGTYKVEIILNEEVDKTLNFEVVNNPN